MTPQQFIAKWQRADLSERSACQQHFLDLCELLGQPKPAEADPDGAWYTFERGVRDTAGAQGWADVWMKDHFGWEYKGKHKNLEAAYTQLLRYREDLENPPLLVVCDLDRFEIHTNFTRTAKVVHRFNLEGLAEPENFDKLRKLFTDPDALRPGLTTESITKQAAELFGKLADRLRLRGEEAHAAAHFLMKLMFCMFAEDVRLLPEKLFTRLLQSSKADPRKLTDRLRLLFTAMARGGDFGADEIRYFNGGLFNDSDVLELKREDIDELLVITGYDWASVEPSIFGTLFERSLDPAKRSQIGAHYTSREDILTLLEPVVMTPLRREWAEVKAECDKLWAEVKTKGKAPGGMTKGAPKRITGPAAKMQRKLIDFSERLAHVRILDPACGSGNFLYVAINLLLDLNKEVISYAQTRDLGLFPQVRPTQLAGIEINPYAQELASVVIWIGYLQWMIQNGFTPNSNPVLEPIETIQLMDAILDLSDPEHPKEPEWPEADFIVGNPPFLGDKLMRGGLGDEYVSKLRRHYDGRVPGGADLCCYWFEKGRDAIKRKRIHRAGLLATQGIRGGANRVVLESIKESGDIFFAVSDREWILDGAMVHVSMVGFDDGIEKVGKTLDGHDVAEIHPNLTAGAAITNALVLPENQGISFLGSCKGGSFDIPEHEALELLRVSGNPHSKPNSDVLRPTVNSRDLLQSRTYRWIIDNAELTLKEACLFERPHKLVVERVKPSRDENRNEWLRTNWWRPQRMRPAMRQAVQSLNRFLVTTTTSKHRLFIWVQQPILPDHQLIVFATSEDYMFALLHSRIHQIWALSQGTQLREKESGFRYTPTTCFETFPFPAPTDAQRAEIAAAAKELDELRTNWLNPPEWTREEILEFPGSTDGPWRRYISSPQPPVPSPSPTIATVRYPRLVPKDEECAKELKKRTLTNLYNQRPTWLDNLHRRLDAAVAAAYGWPADLAEEEILGRLLELNLGRAKNQA
ncbi:MAG: DNA methyltransferase [Pirellulales bacterium]